MTELDKVVNGYHIIENKAKVKPQNFQKFLPHWIKNPVTQYSEDFELNSKLLQNLKTAGYENFLSIQKISIASILSQYSEKLIDQFRCRDVCITAPTGQGKTLCFLVPAINLLINRKIPAIRVLIIVPSKDLAKQIFQITEKLITSTDLKASLIVGGDKSFNQEVQDLLFYHNHNYYLSDIVICTPGRLVDHIFNNENFNLGHLRLLIADEADRFIEDDHQDWFTVLENFIYYNKNSIKKLPNTSLEYALNVNNDLPLQKILSSATLFQNPSLLKKFNLHLPMLILHNKEKKTIPDTNAMETDQDGSYDLYKTPEGLSEYYLITRSNDKLVNFLALIHEDLSNERILVFIKNKEQAENLIKFLQNCSPKINANLICGAFNLNRRQKHLRNFKLGIDPILICTDALARGIDIENVTTVINLDFPPSSVVYIHRSGRTARFDKKGRVITFLDPTQVFHFKKLLIEANRTSVTEMKLQNKKKKPFIIVYNSAMKRMEHFKDCEKNVKNKK